MAFIVQNREEGKTVSLPATASTAYTKNNGVKFTSGYLRRLLQEMLPLISFLWKQKLPPLEMARITFFAIA